MKPQTKYWVSCHEDGIWQVEHSGKMLREKAWDKRVAISCAKALAKKSLPSVVIVFKRGTKLPEAKFYYYE